MQSTLYITQFVIICTIHHHYTENLAAWYILPTKAKSSQVQNFAGWESTGDVKKKKSNIARIICTLKIPRTKTPRITLHALWFDPNSAKVVS